MLWPNIIQLDSELLPFRVKLQCWEMACIYSTHFYRQIHKYYQNTYIVMDNNQPEEHYWLIAYVKKINILYLFKTGLIIINHSLIRFNEVVKHLDAFRFCLPLHTMQQFDADLIWSPAPYPKSITVPCTQVLLKCNRTLAHTTLSTQSKQRSATTACSELVVRHLILNERNVVLFVLLSRETKISVRGKKEWKDKERERGGRQTLSVLSFSLGRTRNKLRQLSAFS